MGAIGGLELYHAGGADINRDAHAGLRSARLGDDGVVFQHLVDAAEGVLAVALARIHLSRHPQGPFYNTLAYTLDHELFVRTKILKYFTYEKLLNALELFF